MRQMIQSVMLDRVVHRYGGVAVLRGLSGRMAHGCVNVVVGANGSGKTTLLRIISSLVAPTSGSVVYHGVSRDRVRSLVGYSLSEALLYPDLTVLDNLRLAAGLYGEGLSSDEMLGMVDLACSRFGVGGMVERYVRELSRGQRQRVSLARSLIHGPSLWVMDEPTAYLDDGGVELFQRVLGEEVAGGKLVVVSTHELGRFDSRGGLPCRVWRLADGRLA